MSTTLKTSVDALQRICEAVEKIRNDEEAVVGSVSYGDVVRQGDLYLIVLSELPVGLLPITDRQLAPGTSQGSRHVLEGGCDIFEIPENLKKTAIEMINWACCLKTKDALHPGRDGVLIGPAFRTVNHVVLTHPEHGNRVLPDNENFVVVYQRALANEVRRQLD